MAWRAVGPVIDGAMHDWCRGKDGCRAVSAHNGRLFGSAEAERAGRLGARPTAGQGNRESTRLSEGTARPPVSTGPGGAQSGRGQAGDELASGDGAADRWWIVGWLRSTDTGHRRFGAG